MDVIREFDLDSWSGPFPAALQQDAVAALEGGAVLLFPRLSFALSEAETALRSPRIIGKSKNVSYNPADQSLGGTVCEGAETELLREMVARFARQARNLVLGLLPRYEPGITQARTSFRPVEVAGRQSSWRKDDTRLHVDSFPSSPTNGKRILRVFSNVNPDRTRVWRVGEPFEHMARRFFAKIRRPLPGSSVLLRLVRVTRSRRSEYDHYMLHLHDAMKEDEAYQQNVPQVRQEFAPGSTWMTFTDEVSHAAVSGQHQFEQTFLVPLNCMASPQLSPLRVLERIAGRPLI